MPPGFEPTIPATGYSRRTMARKLKKKCCVKKPRCKRCPIRALAEGTLPEGYAVKKRRLVKIGKGT